MAGSSVHITRGASSMGHLGDAFRDAFILVVIDLESKQVDSKKFLTMKGHVPFVTVTKVKIKIISY